MDQSDVVDYVLPNHVVKKWTWLHCEFFSDILGQFLSVFLKKEIRYSSSQKHDKFKYNLKVWTQQLLILSNIILQIFEFQYVSKII